MLANATTAGRQQNSTSMCLRSLIVWQTLLWLPLAGAACAEEPASSDVIADESLTTEEYLQSGMPAEDRVWSGDDMSKAAKVLQELTTDGFAALPRYQSERSGTVFARITAAENLEPLQNRKLPVETRLPRGVGYLQASNEVFMVYLNGFVKGEVDGAEVVELMGAQLRASATLFDVVDDFLPTIRKDDPTYEARMQGLGQMKAGLATIASGCLQTLTERDSYRQADLLRLVGHMQQTLPRIVPRLTPSSRTETLVRLEEMQEDENLKDLQPGLGQLYAKVKAAAKKGNAP